MFEHLCRGLLALIWLPMLPPIICDHLRTGPRLAHHHAPACSRPTILVKPLGGSRRAAPATTEDMRSRAASSFWAATRRSSSSSCASFWASLLPSCSSTCAGHNLGRPTGVGHLLRLHRRGPRSTQRRTRTARSSGWLPPVQAGAGRTAQTCDPHQPSLRSRSQLTGSLPSCAGRQGILANARGEWPRLWHAA